MRPSTRHGIVYLTTLVIVGGSIVFGSLFIGVTSMLTSSLTHSQLTEEMNVMLDVVESTASIACFVGDQKLAQEVAHGLLKTPKISRVIIRADQQVLVDAKRPNTSVYATEPAERAKLFRAVHSPFNVSEVIGEIVIVPNLDEIAKETNEEVGFVGMMLLLQIVGSVITIIIVLLYWIVRPIKGISNRLHRMDAASGDQLAVPAGHANTELGSLVGYINALSTRIKASIDEERELRLLSQIGEKKYQAIFANAETGIFICNDVGMLDSFNPAFIKMLSAGSPSEVAQNRNLLDFSWQAPDTLLQLVQACLEANKVLSNDFEMVNGGALRWLNLVLTPIGGKMVQGVVVDVTERKLSESTARLQVITDALTGFSNRTGLESRLTALIELCKGSAEQGFSLMLINIDGFKRINESLGLPIGDEVLKVVATRLAGCFKSSDTLARIGGDEFAVVLPGVTGTDVCERIADRIIKLLRYEFVIGTAPIKLSCSIGVTFFPDDGNDLHSLLRNVELAWGRAKEAGGNEYRFYNADMAAAAERRRSLETDMHMALRNNQFKLFYQPIIDIVNMRIVGAEALIRWQHHDKGFIAPDAFIPLAEETGFVVDIGLWVLETACRQLAEWHKHGKDYYISVNISGKQIPKGLSPERLLEITRRYGVEPSWLALEITEGTLLADVEPSLNWLNTVRGYGFIVYLDDFGTGYSSLSYLKRFPVNTVKVDKSFVKDLSSNAGDRALVGAIVAMATSLGLKVIAEGVETLEQLDVLRRIQCINIQGYYFSKPVPIETFPEVARKVDDLLGMLEINSHSLSD